MGETSDDSKRCRWPDCDCYSPIGPQQCRKAVPATPMTDHQAPEPDDLIARINGRAAFCRDRGEVKTPMLLTQAATALEAAQARIAELEAERNEARRRRDEWRKKAEGYDAVRLALREKVGAPWPPNMSRALWAGIAADEKKRADDAEAAIRAMKGGSGE